MPTSPELQARTRLALLDSIRHWHRHATNTQLPGETMFGDSCALCQLFCDKEKVEQQEGNETLFKGLEQDDSVDEWADCQLCPVMMKTGKDECYDSPWRTLYKTIYCTREGSIQELYAKPEFKSGAAKERDFLISLLLCKEDQLDIQKELGILSPTVVA